jgi:hypothetical protein
MKFWRPPVLLCENTPAKKADSIAAQHNKGQPNNGDDTPVVQISRFIVKNGVYC